MVRLAGFTPTKSQRGLLLTLHICSNFFNLMCANKVNLINMVIAARFSILTFGRGYRTHIRPQGALVRLARCICHRPTSALNQMNCNPKSRCAALSKSNGSCFPKSYTIGPCFHSSKQDFNLLLPELYCNRCCVCNKVNKRKF